MNIFFSVFVLFLSCSVLAQQHPLGNVQQLHQSDLRKNEVKSISAYIHEDPLDSNKADSTIKKGQLQSVWEFDSSGYLISNAMYYPYADKDAMTKTYSYDSLHRIVAYREWSDSVVTREETFGHDNLGRVDRWSLKSDDHKKEFRKQTDYLPNGQPSVVKIYAGKKRIAKDTVYSTYHPDTTLKMQLFIDQETGQTRDSIVYNYHQGDTISSKEVYRDGRITLREYEVKRNFIHFTRTEEYIDGEAMGILTRYLNDDGLIEKEKYTHRYRDMSYTREFSYDKGGLLTQKNVYATGNTPVFYVYYLYEYE